MQEGRDYVAQPEMTHWERIEAAIAGREVDRVPVSLWRHWPESDQDPGALAAATVRWQRAHDFDLVKFMPTGTYGIEDWGATTVYRPTDNGTRTVTCFGVTAAEAWPTLAVLDPAKGYLARQIEALRLAAGELSGTVPILQTVFSPLTTAFKLAGSRVFADLRCHADLFEAGLRTIAETTLAFARASIKAGAHGLFFSSQCSTFRLLTEAEYRRFGEPYDRIVLDGIRSDARFNMLHIHGSDIMFDLMAGYPVEMLNWHDRRVRPDLRDASRRFGGLLVGGLDEANTLANGPVEAIRAEVRQAIAETGGSRLMLAPGCVLPIATPDAHVRAVIEAAAEISARPDGDTGPTNPRSRGRAAVLD